MQNSMKDFIKRYDNMTLEINYISTFWKRDGGATLYSPVSKWIVLRISHDKVKVAPFEKFNFVGSYFVHEVKH